MISHKRIPGAFVLVLLLSLLVKPVQANPSFQQVGNTLVMSNGDVVLNYNLNAGTTDFYWQEFQKDFRFLQRCHAEHGIHQGYQLQQLELRDYQQQSGGGHRSLEAVCRR